VTQASLDTGRAYQAINWCCHVYAMRILLKFRSEPRDTFYGDRRTQDLIRHDDPDESIWTGPERNLRAHDTSLEIINFDQIAQWKRRGVGARVG
jgi:hypothetical protein